MINVVHIQEKLRTSWLHDIPLFNVVNLFVYCNAAVSRYK
jgi:hypothetical protein